MLIGSDIAHLWSIDPDFPNETPWMAFRDYAGPIGILPLIFVTLGARPRVDVFEDRLILRNLIFDHTVPRAAYVGVKDGLLGYVKVVTTDRSLYAFGLEQWTFEGAPRECELLPSFFLDTDAEGPTPVEKRLRRPAWYKVVIYVSLGVYYVLALSIGTVGA
ncbi:hypothetical protein [Pseudokineococcus sp. 1T1Z-3]|uniref:hypothetical protein n=1 Tax=Pseudokineococcus sp. 1T1Z-3 TaxID=3132745 RepID=UPI0030A5F510